MVKHELYKILSRKSIYVLLILILAMMTYAAFAMSFGDYTMKYPIFDELAETWGGPVTEEKVANAREIMRTDDEEATNNPSPTTQTVDESRESYVHFLTIVAGMYSDELVTEKERLQSEMEKHDSNTYKYRVADKKLTMLEELGQPYGYYVIQAWRGMHILIEPTFSSMFLIILVLIGLTPVFSEEHTQRTAGLIAATKHGKSKIVTAKILASLTYIFGIFLILNIANTFIQWFFHGGFAGWDVPVQSFFDYYMSHNVYQYSPFNWVVWQTYAVTLGIQLFAAVIVALLVLFLSSRIKNTMMGFFIGGSILIAPALFTSLGLTERYRLFKIIKDFSYLELLRADGLINQFKAYNLFGQPILYSTVILILFTILSAAIVALTYYGVSKQEINE